MDLNISEGTKNIRLFESYMEICCNDLKSTLRFYYIWLRDHCKCSECYNSKTQQISSNILDIPLNIKPSACEIKNDKLLLFWKDQHKTEFSIKWLKSIEFPAKNKRDIILWNRNDFSHFKDMHVPVEMYLRDNNGVKCLLNSLLKYGVGFVTGVTPTIEATVEVVKHIAPLQKTFFGETWTVSNDYYHSDTAYTNIGLATHTDNTYFTEAAGLQIFHMLLYNQTGGETLLADGFNVAHYLRKNHKDAFDTLCTIPVRSHYIEEGYHFFTIEPVIKLHPLTNDLVQIRYNKYDRSTFDTVPQEKILQFYEAYQFFGKEASTSKNEFQIKLQPGSVIFIDNWRILHGRNAYTGSRNLCGCYITRSEWLSRATSLGLEVI